MNLSVEPSIEDIRKIANERRPKVKTPPAPKKINKKKVKEPEPEPVPEPEPEPPGPVILEESESEEESEEEEVIIPIQKKSSKKKVIDTDYEVLKQLLKTSNKKDKEYDTLYKNITDIKELITKQKDAIEEAIKPKIEEPKTKPKPKPKAKSKPKATGKKLDLVVSDKELDTILNPPVNNTKPIDPKLAEFLKAFQK